MVDTPLTVAPATPGPPAASPRGPEALLVLYDGMCAFCVRCRRWLEAQAMAVPVSFLPAHWEQARRLAGHLPLGKELVVLGSDGSAWVGDDAFVMCLWATRRYRRWALRLAAGGGRKVGRAVFATLTSGRRLLGSSQPDNCDTDVCLAANTPIRR